MKSSTQATSHRYHKPSATVIVGSILAMGVLRLLERKRREDGQDSPLSPAKAATALPPSEAGPSAER